MHINHKNYVSSYTGIHCIQISDISVEDYITATAAKHPVYVPHTAGRYQAKRFRKAQCPIAERLTNSLMMHGRNNGKKLMAVRIVKHAMEIIHLLTDENPIQIIVNAVINRYLDWSMVLLSLFPSTPWDTLQTLRFGN